MLNFFVLALCSLSVSVLVKLHQNALLQHAVFTHLLVIHIK